MRKFFRPDRTKIDPPSNFEVRLGLVASSIVLALWLLLILLVMGQKTDIAFSWSQNLQITILSWGAVLALLSASLSWYLGNRTINQLQEYSSTQLESTNLELLQEIQVRKQAEAALRESLEALGRLQERYELANFSGEIGVWDWDIQKNEFYIDPNLKAELGYSELEAKHIKDWYKMVHPDDKKQVRAAIADHLKGLTPQLEIEYRRLHKDGSDRWYLSRGMAFFDANNQPYRFTGIDNNITVHKRIETALQESEARMRAVMDNSTAVIFIKDTESRFLFINRKFENLFQITNEEVKGKTDYDLFSQEIADVVRENDRQVLTSLAPLELEEIINQEDGLHTYMSVKFPLIDAQSGRAYAVCGMAHDITQRKRTEEELKKISRLQTAILDSANYSIISTDPDGIIQTFNLAAQQWLGYTAQEVVGKTTPMIFHDRDEVTRKAQILSTELGEEIAPGLKVFLAKVYRGIFEKDEWTYIRKDGSRLDIRLSITAMRDEQNNITGFLGIANDITLIKQTEAARKDSEERYQDLFENANDLIQSVSPEGNFIYINRAWRETLGYNDAEIAKLPVFDVIHPDCQENFREIFERVLAGEKIDDFEIEFLTKHGRKIMLEGSANCKFIEGRPVATRAIFRNVSDRKQIEQEQQESRAVLQAMYNLATNPQLNLNQRFHEVLALGCQYFSLDYALFAEIKGNSCTVFAAQTPDNSVAVGYVYDLTKAYCLDTVQQSEPLWIEHATASAWCTHPGYDCFKMESYFGMRILVNEAVYGVLCFCSKVPSSRQFRSVDNELLKLMAQWIGSEIERQQIQQEMQESEALIRDLYQATTNPKLDFAQRLKKLLELGSEYFGLEFGLTAQMQGHFCEVIRAISPNNILEAGFIYEVEQTFCNEVVKAQEPFWVSHASQSEWRNHPGYTVFQKETYIGVPVWVNGSIYGVLCFSSSTPTKRAFRSLDPELMQLMAQWIGSEIQRNSALQEIEQLQHQNQLILNSAGEGIYGIDLEGRFSFINQSAAIMLGYEPQELLGLNAHDLIHHSSARKETYPLHACPIYQTLQTGKSCCVDSEVYWRKYGTSFPVEYASYPIVEKGAIQGAVVTFSDITERKQAEANLRLEQEKTERLLLNILPEAIAQRLKQEERTIADSFASVTVLFADLVGFTQLSTRVSPQELVNLLNQIFSEFDQLATQHGVEKIKTIGDAYMVAGGLPIERPDHAEAIAEMALDMQMTIKQFNKEIRENLSIRIGINTGPVVAGVIGLRKFIYDLWGDTVNTASRMESHSIPDSIQVSPATYELLKDQYIFEERGVINIKGKGEMNTYLLTSRKHSKISCQIPIR